MAIYALIDSTGTIVNRIVLDNPNDYAVGSDYQIVREVDPMEIGATYLNGVYTPLPPPDPLPMPRGVPSSASRLGLMRALKEIGQWDSVKAALASNPDAQEEWDLAVEIRRTDPLTQAMIANVGLTDAQVDALLIRADDLVA